MFKHIFIEENLTKSSEGLSKIQNITKRFPKIPTTSINKVEDYFGKVKKPYLQKRQGLNLFLGEKKGKIVKPAAATYGLQGVPHYYFAQSYNCLYECDYCYLQGYFHSPDIVLFLNHTEIATEIKKTAEAYDDQPVWFHAGEYSDSLLLSHLTGELPFYFELFSKLPHALLELRTKSVNIRELLNFAPLSNIVTSFSLSPQFRSIENDLLTPPTSHRLKAISKLHLKQFPIGIHFDPIIYSQDLIPEYEQLIDDLSEAIDLSQIRYLSLGVVRFTKDVYHQVQNNYPQSTLHAEEFVKSFDNKVRYNRPMRQWILSTIKSLLLKKGMTEAQIYFCMEDLDE